MNPVEATPDNMDSPPLPYLLFSIGKNTYAIHSEYVRGIETLCEFTAVVDSDPHVRGGVFYQEAFIPLIDMRKLFKLDSQLEEFEKSVCPDERIRDHENWVKALETSVQNDVEFTLTDDPHQCAFGRWYYSFKTDNNTLKHQLSAIENPHVEIHNTAKAVKALMLEQKREQALSAIKQMRDTHFQTTVHILSSLRNIVKDNLKELYIIVDCGACLKGLIVDAIVGVETFVGTLPLPESVSNSKYIDFLGRREKGHSTVFVLKNVF